jgi:hypothetical protein
VPPSHAGAPSPHPERRGTIAAPPGPTNRLPVRNPLASWLGKPFQSPERNGKVAEPTPSPLLRSCSR